MSADPALALPVEIVPLASLKPHPQNYRTHPEDELVHLEASIRAHGVYHNIVVAEESTILAGHGVVLALQRIGQVTVPVVRLPLAPTDPRALQVLTGDNEISHLTESDDRLLCELLRTIHAEAPAGLQGTGYDDAMLANLLMVTRPATEVADFDAAAAWVGMPAFEGTTRPWQAVVSFESEADRTTFMTRLDATPRSVLGGGRTVLFWWPNRPDGDLASLQFAAPGAAHARDDVDPASRALAPPPPVSADA